MDRVDELAHIVLTGGVVQLVHIEVSGRIVDGPSGHLHIVAVQMIDSDGGSAAACTGGKVTDDLLRGPKLTALEKMRGGRGRHHTVFQDDIADPDRL